MVHRTSALNVFDFDIEEEDLRGFFFFLSALASWLSEDILWIKTSFLVFFFAHIKRSYRSIKLGSNPRSRLDYYYGDFMNFLELESFG